MATRLSACIRRYAGTGPNAAFYGFDLYLESRDLGYRGPALGYWSIPDQFALARFEQMHPRGPDVAPRFVFFPTITTHLPFNPVPPYQPDWARVLTAQPFDAADVQRALGEAVNWLDMFPDYLRMIDYNYRWLGGLPAPARAARHGLRAGGRPSAGRQHHRRGCVLGRAGAHRLARCRTAGSLWRDGLPHRPRAAAQPLGALHDLTAMLLGAFAADGTKFAGGGSATVTQAAGLR